MKICIVIQFFSSKFQCRILCNQPLLFDITRKGSDGDRILFFKGFPIHCECCVVSSISWMKTSNNIWIQKSLFRNKSFILQLPICNKMVIFLEYANPLIFPQKSWHIPGHSCRKIMYVVFQAKEKRKKKISMVFCISKIRQILKNFTRSFHQAQTSYFWRNTTIGK